MLALVTIRVQGWLHFHQKIKFSLIAWFHYIFNLPCLCNICLKGFWAFSSSFLDFALWIKGGITWGTDKTQQLNVRSNMLKTICCIHYCSEIALIILVNHQQRHLEWIVIRFSCSRLSVDVFCILPCKYFLYFSHQRCNSVENFY